MPGQAAKKRATQQAVVNSSTSKRRRGRPRKAKAGNLKSVPAVQSVKRSRPRFELQNLDSSEQGVVFKFAL